MITLEATRINVMTILAVGRTMVERLGDVRYGAQETLEFMDNAIRCKILDSTCLNAESVPSGSTL